MTQSVDTTFRNLPADASLEGFVRREVSRLDRYYNHLMSAQVVVELQGHHRHGNRYHVRIRLVMPGGELVVERAPSLHASAAQQEQPGVRKESDVGRVYRKPERAISEAFGEMRRRLQDYARKQRGDTKAASVPLAEGRVVRLEPVAGFGFLETLDGRSIYFHSHSVVGGHFKLLRVGAPVRFLEQPGQKGPQASTVKLVRPRRLALAAAASVPV